MSVGCDDISQINVPNEDIGGAEEKNRVCC